LFQRKLLPDPRVQAALRWRGEDKDPEVRRLAFLLSLYTREKLLQALRTGDPELHRQLTELESGNLPETEGKAAEVAASSGGGGVLGALSNTLSAIAGQIETLTHRPSKPEKP
jgi:hypothetical protein